MTVKEIAELTARTERTVRRWASKAAETSDTLSAKMTYAYRVKEPADFDIEETEKILRVSTVPKMVVDSLMISAKNGKDNVAPMVPDYEVIGRMIGMAVQAALVPVVNKLDQIGTKALPSPIREDRYSLVGYCSLNHIPVDRSALSVHGRNLRRMANEQGMIIGEIPDERWGQVNSYPVEILEEYFAL